jgi:hypothetical protein
VRPQLSQLESIEFAWEAATLFAASTSSVVQEEAAE